MKVAHMYYFTVLLLIGCACDKILDKPWQKESYVYQDAPKMMRNLIDATKDVPAERMNGAVCKMPAYEEMQELERIRLEQELRGCQNK